MLADALRLAVGPLVCRNYPHHHTGLSCSIGQPINEVVAEFDYFAYCVLTGTDPELDGHDGLADVQAIEAVYEAAANGRRVEIDA